MKKVISIIALVVLAGSVANAQLKNFKYDGMLDLHKYSNTNTADFNKAVNDKTNDQDYRANIGFNFEAGEGANVQVNLISTAANNVEFGQAYLGIDNLLGIGHKFGRMFYGDQGDLVIYYGPDYWYVSDMPYTATEGWLGEYKYDKLTVNALIAKEVDVKKDTYGADIDVYGVKANYPVNDMINPTVYYYQKADNTVAPLDRLNVMGAKITGKYMGFEYAGEYAMNNGAETATADYAGNAMKFNVGYGLDLMGKLNLGFEYLSTSGDDTSADKDEEFFGISSNYKPGFICGNFGAVIGDVTTWNIGADWNLEKVNKLTVGAKYFNFALTEDKDKVGNELDITAKWAHSENVTLGAYYAMFMIDSDYATVNLAGNDDNASQMGLFASVKF